MLFWALLAAGQITMRKVDGWETLTQKLADKPIDLAASTTILIHPETAPNKFQHTLRRDRDHDLSALLCLKPISARYVHPNSRVGCEEKRFRRGINFSNNCCFVYCSNGLTKIDLKPEVAQAL
jgi:hypothetical protein